jgi:alpha-1,6-mannosyltransferase
MKIYLEVVIYAIVIFSLGYFIPREFFAINLILYGVCFFIFLKICLGNGIEKFTLIKGLLFAFLIRMMLIIAIPSLSDDFYRYLFDGHLIKMGYNPYLITPNEFVKSNNLSDFPIGDLLFSNLNSPAYFSIYPPLHQVFFYLASLGGQDLLSNIVILRLIIIAFDFLNIYLIFKILKVLDQPVKKIWLYAFNPLIILELTGNLHFEGLVLTGILAFVYFSLVKKNALSAIGWSWSIGIKLTPMMFIGYIFAIKEKSKVYAFAFFSLVLISIFFFPLLINNGYENLFQSVRLFQNKFEFNASLYYLVNWIARCFIDYNPIAYVGPSLQFMAFISIILYSIIRWMDNEKEVCSGFVHIYLIYFLFQSVVHPWYIIPAFGISLFTKSKIFLTWTGLIFLSYHAYANASYQESLIFLLLEYAPLFILIYKENILKISFWNFNPK